MVRKRSFLLPGMLVLSIILVGAGILSYQQRAESKKNLVFKIGSLNVNDVNTCSFDTDCLLVEGGVCGDPTAISADHQELWGWHLKWIKFRAGLVMCEPSLPWDWFEPRCVNTRCETVMLQDQAILQFHYKPLVGRPARLRLSFRLSQDAHDIKASIQLPEGIRLVSGSPDWQGEVKGDQEIILEVIVQADEPGYYQIEGTVTLTRDTPLTLRHAVDMEITTEDAFLEPRPVNHWQQHMGISAPMNSDRLRTEFLIDSKPALGEEFTFTFRVTPLAEFSDQKMQVTLALPENAFQVVSLQTSPAGDSWKNSREISWSGPPEMNSTVEIQLVLKPVRTGWGPLYGMVFIPASSSSDEYSADTLIADLYVGEHAGGFTIRRP